jgi:hypothetical protein
MGGHPSDRALGHRVALWCGVISGPVFMTTSWVEGASRDGYSPKVHPISALALGDRGWRQTANFFAAGILITVFAVGVRRDRPGQVPAPVLPMVAAGVGLIISGVFPTDPVNGYPPGPAQLEPVESTPAGLAHNLASLPVMLGLPAAALSHGLRSARAGHHTWAATSIAAGLLSLLGFALAAVGFGRADNEPLAWAGGFQRIGVLAGMGWLSALAIRLFRWRH